MSEPAVDVDSRTSLAKRWWSLQKADFTKKGVVATTVLNYAFAAIGIWMYIAPHFEARGAENAQATLSQLKEDKSALEGDVKHWSGIANANQLANDELIGQKAEHLAKLQELERKLETATSGEGPKAPIAKQAALSPPTVKRVKTKAIQAPKEEPSTCDQIDACKAFVAWYEANVGTGAN